MPTAEMTTELTLVKVGQLLGPESTYALERSKLRAQYRDLLEAAKAVRVIDSQEKAAVATELGRLLHVAGQETEKFFKSIKVQIDNIKKPILEAEKADLGALNGEKQRLAEQQTAWDLKVRQETEAAERKAREETAKRAQEELLLRAVELEEAGEAEQAEILLEEPIVVTPVIHRSAPKLAGKVSGTTYSAKVTDLRALVRAVADGRAPMEALGANESFLNQMARSYKEGFSMPGCELVTTNKTHYRG